VPLNVMQSSFAYSFQWLMHTAGYLILSSYTICPYSAHYSCTLKDEGRRFLSAKLHGIRFQKAVNLHLIAMRNTYHVYSNAE